MLVHLDVAIGTIVVLLGISLVVTMVNQALSSLFALRGSNLRWGLTTLVQELHAERFGTPPATGLRRGRRLNADARAATTLVLKHPLVSDSSTPFWHWRLASTIRFDEFVKTVLLLGETPLRPDGTAADDAGGREALAWLRQNHRLTEAWFNSVMDRVSQRFLMHMRGCSIVVSAVIVLVIGMDTLHIVNALRQDAALRSELGSVAEALSRQETLDADARTGLEAYAGALQSGGIGADGFSRLFWQRQVVNVPGMLLSVALLSLGAPFWFGILKNLVALRSAVAKREEQEPVAGAPPDVAAQIRVRSFV